MGVGLWVLHGSNEAV